MDDLAPVDRSAARSWSRLAQQSAADCAHETEALAQVAAYFYVSAAAAAALASYRLLGAGALWTLPPLFVLASTVESTIRARGGRDRAAHDELALLRSVRTSMSRDELGAGLVAMRSRARLRRQAWRSLRELRLLPMGVLAAVASLEPREAFVVVSLLALGAGALILRRAGEALWVGPRQLDAHLQLCSVIGAPGAPAPIARGPREGVPAAPPLQAPLAAAIRELAEDARRELAKLSPSRPELEAILDRAVAEAEALEARREALELAAAKARARGVSEERQAALASELERLSTAIHALAAVLADVHVDAVWLSSLGQRTPVLESIRTEEQLLHASALGLGNALAAVEAPPDPLEQRRDAGADRRQPGQ